MDARLDEIQEASARLQGITTPLRWPWRPKGGRRSAHAPSPQLSQTAAGYFQQLTQGRFSQVALDRSFNVTVRETGALADRPLALLSQGTADQLYLALRLAVADLVLPSPQACPLILDDALLSFDDDRLAVVLHLLTELAEDRQILLFTCQHREFFMLEDRPEITTVTLPDF
ncbi:MAG: ATP-binding protein [Evtepia gabavorous]